MTPGCKQALGVAKIAPMPPAELLLVSNGHAEDLIGAALLRALGRPARVAPLVGGGRAYAGLADAVSAPLRLPSGGFPFASLDNLRADLRAGLISGSLGQWRAARRGARGVRAVVAVGDAYALGVAQQAAGGLPVFHLQPLVSVLYSEGMTLGVHLRELNALGANFFLPPEIALMRRARRVYTRDAASAEHLRRRGVNAAWHGSFAMDVLPTPERDLGPLQDGRPVLALLPGSRGDAAFSLPLMLEAARQLPEVQALVAWPGEWAALPVPSGWRVRVVDEGLARLEQGETGIFVLRGAFGALLRVAALALGTAGTASEQAAGLGVPLLGFVTPGPQYTPSFARRQARLLGAALALVEADPQALAAAVRHLLVHPEWRALAARAGRARIGPPGAIPRIAQEIGTLLDGPQSPAATGGRTRA